ncbi:MAG: TIGR04348 family glycosyltransferase, partial [Chloroflexota bacterium]
MPTPKIVIVTPAPPGSRSGNRNTAVRWSRILRGLGCRVAIVTRWEGENCDCLVALHARKSAHSLEAFVSRRPGRPAVLALTGTDLYRDIRHDASAQAALRQATRLVVLQECAPAELDDTLRAKTRVIYQSETAHGTWQPPRRHLRLCVLGHLREEKDPFRTALALDHLERDAAIEVVHAGKALTDGMAQEARRLMRHQPRYRWIGEVPHWRALRLMLRSHAMVV